MGGVVLFDYPASHDAARQFLVSRIAMLRLDGSGTILFIGKDAHGQEMLALSVPGILAAEVLLAAWQAEPSFPTGIVARVWNTGQHDNQAPLAFP